MIDGRARWLLPAAGVEKHADEALLNEGRVFPQLRSPMKKTSTLRLARIIVLGAPLVLGACKAPKQEAEESGRLVEASCGQCNFDLPGDGCDLAVRMDGEAYFVDGSSIDEHGDAHAAEGMCNAIRQARVEGDVSEGRFVATSFTLLPE